MTIALPPLPGGGMPLYQGLRHALTQGLDDGTYSHNDKIPSENTLAKHYGISRHVVRQALDRLVAEGRLQARQGAGYFVNERRIRVLLPSLTGFTEAMRVAGQEARTELLSCDFVVATPLLKERLRVPAAKRILKIVRVGVVEGEPVATLEGYYPPRVGQHLKGVTDLTEGVYALLSRFGMRPTAADNSLRVGYADVHDAARLAVPEGSAIVEVTSVARDTEDKPMEFVRGAYRADRFEFGYVANASQNVPMPR
jgi:GntR family transcriptional regulator